MNFNCLIFDSLFEGFNYHMKKKYVDLISAFGNGYKCALAKRLGIGYVEGHDEVRNYWTRQRKEINPNVEPVSVNENENDEIEVNVHQVVKDMQGNALADGMVKHIYTLKNGLI
jgi:hypothetical protein